MQMKKGLHTTENRKNKKDNENLTYHERRN